jgi:WD40 repeat protein
LLSHATTVSYGPTVYILSARVVPQVPYLLASGDEDGHFRVWDLRSFKSGQPVHLIYIT